MVFIVQIQGAERRLMLIETTLFGVENKVDDAIALLQAVEPPDGYHVAFSGGKDSIVIKDLVIKSGVKYDIHYQNTTIDPPELGTYIRELHPEVQQHYPERSYFKEMVKRGFPLRQQRWCCEFLKEKGGSGRTVITGIRADESLRRSKRGCYEKDFKDKTKIFLNIILRWTETEVWEYIRASNLPYCKLYDQGWKRIGCLGCPMQYYKRKMAELDKYPKIKRLYARSFIKIYDKKKSEGKTSVDRWVDGKEMFEWWLNEKWDKEGMPLFS